MTTSKWTVMLTFCRELDDLFHYFEVLHPLSQKTGCSLFIPRSVFGAQKPRILRVTLEEQGANTEAATEAVA